LREVAGKLTSVGQTPRHRNNDWAVQGRKLLHAIYEMFTTKTTFVGETFMRPLDAGESI
jgi:hypothetical protein